MNFEHTEDRRMLADTLEPLCRRAIRYRAPQQASLTATEGHSAELYAQFAELGAIGALFTEEDGGFGGAGFDISVVFESLGRGLVAEPLLGALVVGQALIAAGTESQKASAWKTSSPVA